MQAWPLSLAWQDAVLRVLCTRSLRSSAPTLQAPFIVADSCRSMPAILASISDRSAPNSLSLVSIISTSKIEMTASTLIKIGQGSTGMESTQSPSSWPLAAWTMTRMQTSRACIFPHYQRQVPLPTGCTSGLSRSLSTDPHCTAQLPS